MFIEKIFFIFYLFFRILGVLTMDLNENTSYNNIRRSKRIFKKVNKLRTISKITKAHIHSPIKKSKKRNSKKGIDKSFYEKTTNENSTDLYNQNSNEECTLKIVKKRKNISRYSDKKDNIYLPKIIKNKNKITKKKNTKHLKNENASKSPIILKKTKSFIDNINSSFSIPSQKHNINPFEIQSQKHNINTFEIKELENNNSPENMLKIATDIEAFKKQFKRINELSKNNNIIFSKNSKNIIIPKVVDNFTFETNNHIISSESGLINTFENFQLLSSDPLEPEDDFMFQKPSGKFLLVIVIQLFKLIIDLQFSNRNFTYIYIYIYIYLKIFSNFFLFFFLFVYILYDI